MLFDRVAIVGLGLIGGSLARALRRASLCGSITGYGRREAALQQAVEHGVIDHYSLDAPEAVDGADVVILATPLSTTENLMRAMNEGLKPDCIVTDVGSAKGVVVEAARNALAGRLPLFVPAHPIAGTEQSGVEASFAELFEDHVVIITPLAETDRDAREKIAAMWRGTGARVVELDVEHHDEVLAATSHLPHVLVYTLIDCLARMQDRQEIFDYAAGGFADFTRVASSSPEMWRDICLANSAPLLAVLDRFERHLDRARQAIASGEGEKLTEIFSRARQARDEFARNRGR
jgi:prephenate dehydrogenase